MVVRNSRNIADGKLYRHIDVVGWVDERFVLQPFIIVFVRIDSERHLTKSGAFAVSLSAGATTRIDHFADHRLSEEKLPLSVDGDALHLYLHIFFIARFDFACDFIVSLHPDTRGCKAPCRFLADDANAIMHGNIKGGIGF